MEVAGWTSKKENFQKGWDERNDAVLELSENFLKVLFAARGLQKYKILWLMLQTNVRDKPTTPIQGEVAIFEFLIFTDWRETSSETRQVLALWM